MMKKSPKDRSLVVVLLLIISGVSDGVALILQVVHRDPMTYVILFTMVIQFVTAFAFWRIHLKTKRLK